MVFDAKLKLFDFLLQLNVLVVVLFYKFILVHSLVCAAIHALKETSDNFFKTLSQVIFFLLRYGTFLKTFLVCS